MNLAPVRQQSGTSTRLGNRGRISKVGWHLTSQVDQVCSFLQLFDKYELKNMVEKICLFLKCSYSLEQSKHSPRFEAIWIFRVAIV